MGQNFLLTEYDNVMDIFRIVETLTPYAIFRTLHQDVSQSPQELEVWSVYHLYGLKTISSVSLRNVIVRFLFWGYIRHMRTKLQAHVQSQTRMEETHNTDDLATFTVKPVLSGHSKLDKTKILMSNDGLMKVESIAKCSPWNILQYFRPALSDNRF